MNKKLSNVCLALALILCIPVIVSADQISDTITNITNWIMTIAISVAAMMYVIGGFMWLADTGDTKRVTSAKNIIVSTTFGLIVILIAKGIVSIVQGFVK